eukprot:CAMPEP_0170197986 /NCGR_PEP_ID=MMETSP0040_2-20121228/67708_1 /TAXON_ID=641309 /ORGANISM="Lotharella oceanica, Strain CCMP622" /LENGTH=110 /DNA_ID=CAMNT_0010447809 /DNA_START=421 /DNA_END=750 /DNA_ORIENTATION=+
MRSLICTRWSANKNGRTARRITALCNRLSTKSHDWASLRQQLVEKESEIKRLEEALIREEAKARFPTPFGPGKLAVLETLERLPATATVVVNLSFGTAFIPRASLSLRGE